MRVEWTDPALDDLDGIRNYISNDSPITRNASSNGLLLPLKSWRRFPKIGRTVPEAEGRGDVRELIVQGYRIIYRTKPDRVQVVQVITAVHAWQPQFCG